MISHKDARRRFGGVAARRGFSPFPSIESSDTEGVLSWIAVAGVLLSDKLQFVVGLLLTQFETSI
jgi:hypothetical protein